MGQRLFKRILHRICCTKQSIFLIGIILGSIFLIACEPTTTVNGTATARPFPTVTVGQVVAGNLPPVGFIPDENSVLSNPATVVALVNQPSPTPNFSACPELREVAPPNTPQTHAESLQAIVSFLSNGGNLDSLEFTLQNRWRFFGEEKTNGYVRTVDLTEEGIPEILVGYTNPEGQGVFLMLGCVDRQYTIRMQEVADVPDPPQILWTNDINLDLRPDLLVADTACDTDGYCEYVTRILNWDILLQSFVNLTNDVIASDTIPILNDFDSDDVAEIIVQLETRGSAETGPLRTGTLIYDWDGSLYRLSQAQLDPPRFWIHVLHEADTEFARQNVSTAINLYESSLANRNLRYWFNDGPDTMRSYTLYRLLMTYAYANNRRALAVLELLQETYPQTTEDGAPLDLPVYAEMSYAFWQALEETQNLNSGCLAVQAVMESRPEALNLLNRYGSRNPTYISTDLCPF